MLMLLEAIVEVSEGTILVYTIISDHIMFIEQALSRTFPQAQ